MRRVFSIVVSLLCAACLCSCTAISVNKLPQPGRNYGDGYELIIEFDNALNLPDRAKVVMDGTTVGVVDRISIGKNAVDVTTRIDRDVKVPSDVRASLQQATVLGDMYVALERPASTSEATKALAPDGRVPLAQTTSPPQLEDTLANLANFVASGSIQRVQNSIIKINSVTPERAEKIRAIAARVSADLSDLSANIDTVDQWLNGVSQTAQVMADRIPQYQYWFSPEGMLGWKRISEFGVYIGILLPSVGSVYSGGFWLVPLLKSLGVAVGAVQKSKWAIEGEYRPWRSLFTDLFLPQDKYPAMNITSVQTADGRDITGNVQDVMRMLGAIP